MNNVNLKSCLFCGSNEAPHIMTDYETGEDDEGFVAVVCDMERGGCGASSLYSYKDEEVIETWNRRVRNES